MNSRSMTIVFLCLGPLLAPCTFGQTQSSKGSGHSQILSALRARFQNHNPLVAKVELNDIRALDAEPIVSFTKPNRYLVLARGIRSDERLNGRDFHDELFGIFLFDDSLFSVLRTIDIIPTQRWNDYAIRIVKIWKDTLTIHGEGIAYGDAALDRKYHLDLREHNGAP